MSKKKLLLYRENKSISFCVCMLFFILETDLNCQDENTIFKRIQLIGSLCKTSETVLLNPRDPG